MKLNASKNNNLKHLAIFQIWGLGDLVMTTPVIAEFRRLHPKSKLTLVVRGRAQAELLSDSPLVDEIIDMGKVSGPLGLIRFFRSLRAHRFDGAFIGTRISWRLPLLLRTLTGVPVVIGDSERARFLYTHCNSIDHGVHRVDRMLETFGLWSGEQASQVEFPLPYSESSHQTAIQLIADSGSTPGEYIVLHPGSSTKAGTQKRIPAAVAKRVIDDLRSLPRPPRIAVIFGPDEMDLVPEFASCGEGVVSFQKLPLDVVHAILATAAGFIGTDSALGHIAAAFGVPTMTIAGPTNPAETRPYGQKSIVIAREPKLPCQPCWGTPSFWNCPIGVRCMNELPEQKVVEVASKWCQN